MTGGRPAAGKTDATGKYKLEFTRNATGALSGEHVVEISTADELGMEDGTSKVIPEKVPAKYNVRTELRATIEEGANVFDWDLSSEGEILSEGDLELETEG
jgi:hypothetical protein